MVSVSEVQSFEIDLSKSRKTSAEYWQELIEGDRRPRKGDVIYCRNTSVGAAAFVSSDAPIAMGQDVCLIRSAHQNTRFLNYALRCDFMIHQLQKIIVGATFKRVNVIDIKNFLVPVPPVADQRAIVAFLDRETGKIDRLKEVRREQIKVLREQRAAVIHHAVTQGLDPHAPKKESGIPWLGEVPEHWEVRRLKTVSRISAGGTPASTERSYWDGDVIWLCPTDLGKANQRSITCSARKITLEGVKAANLDTLPVGSLVISTRAPVGSLGLLDVEATTNQGCKGVVFDKRAAVPDFFYFLIQCAVSYMNAAAQGATFVELSGAQLKDLGIIRPSVKEQKEIVAHIDRETSKIDTLIAKYEKELELLDEYRASLISHAVTGKIDVRGLVEAEPEAVLAG